MKHLRDIRFFLLGIVFLGISAFNNPNRTIATEGFITPDQDLAPNVNQSEHRGLSLSDSVIIADVYATAYYCIYNSEIAGFQTVTRIISNETYILKASFLFGGHGVPMQGTGRTGPGGDYIKYIGGGGCFVYITGPKAGQSLKGRWIEDPQVIRNRYARLGITDFTGFGNLALVDPDGANFSCSAQISGSGGEILEPWQSIAVDPSMISLCQICTLVFKNGATTPYGASYVNVKAEDFGGVIKDRHIDIYLGEGESAWNQWLQTGGNRYVDVYQLSSDLTSL
jgi:3D (Asp-Asp-Asp) domain-containing protein